MTLVESQDAMFPGEIYTKGVVNRDFMLLFNLQSYIDQVGLICQKEDAPLKHKSKQPLLKELDIERGLFTINDCKVHAEMVPTYEYKRQVLSVRTCYYRTTCMLCMLSTGFLSICIKKCLEINIAIGSMRAMEGKSTIGRLGREIVACERGGTIAQPPPAKVWHPLLSTLFQAIDVEAKIEDFVSKMGSKDDYWNNSVNGYKYYVILSGNHKFDYTHENPSKDLDLRYAVHVWNCGSVTLNTHLGYGVSTRSNTCACVQIPMGYVLKIKMNSIRYMTINSVLRPAPPNMCSFVIFAHFKQ